MTVTPDDERPHPAASEPSWVESTWLELHDATSQLAGIIRLDDRPNLRTSEVSFSFFLPDAGFVTARHVTPQAGDRLDVVEIEDARLETVEPLRRWAVKYDGPSHSLPSVAETGSREAWSKSRLERLIVELELAAVRDAVGGRASFAQLVHVSGEVWVSGDRYEIATSALRGRSWGSGAVPRTMTRVSLTFGDERALLARLQKPDGEPGDAEALDGWTLADGVVRPVQAMRVEPADAGPGATAGGAIVVTDARGEHRIRVELPHVAPMPGAHGGRSYELRIGAARAIWDGCEGRGFVEQLR
ncbi:hypothetical protein K2Z84_13125 [Candidatus Binatia bacterium]|nr:hypothetical protein [Candidatus Binatia bacterium]